VWPLGHEPNPNGVFAKINCGVHRLCFCGIGQLEPQASVRVQLVLRCGFPQGGRDVAEFGDQAGDVFGGHRAGGVDGACDGTGCRCFVALLFDLGGPGGHDGGAGSFVEGFAKACAAQGIQRSMGVVGSSTDNAVAEAWFSSLKRELPYGTRWATRERARLDVFGWIAFYNNRLHSALGYISPTAYEKRNTPTTMLALAA